LGYVFGWTFFENFAIDEDVSSGTDTEGFSDVVIGDKDAYLFCLKISDDLLNILHRDRIDSCEWFVEKNKEWV
jgi:hypothetical protein